MGIFQNRDQYEGYNIYSMKKYVDKKRITFIITAIILIFINSFDLSIACMHIDKGFKI